MLDLQRMFQPASPQHNQPQQQQPFTPHQPDSWGDHQSPFGLSNWQGLWSNLLDRLHGAAGTPTTTTPTTPTMAPQPQQTSPSTLAPAYVGEAGARADPFGPSINNGTLGAMLARQPGVF